ncbi:MAG: hypothetical protein DHS20C18_33970 [Saprospiraceae bacterium]|nr:MAG: hypothetical protein DHS20C18_33970 [Saprospiraceae bacterium]
MKKHLIIALIALSFSTLLCGQINDMSLLKGARKVDIPFEYVNNFIIVKLVFNRVFPLKFIFDTGAEHTILTKREITDLLQINYLREFKVMGSDMKTELTAYLANNIHLKINNIVFFNHSILVLEDDYFRFDEFAGVNVQGILGADLFRRFIVKINYHRKVITLYDPRYFSPPKDFKEIPVELYRNKPYLFANGLFQQQQTDVAIKLLVDTGASLSLLLHTDSDSSFHLPPNVILSNIGLGLGGFLEGYTGRIQQLDLSSFKLNNVLTNFQNTNPEIDPSYLNNRNGIIGNQLLNRFTIIIDYIRPKMYLKPNRRFAQKFKYDKSGLSLAATGVNLNHYTVLYLVPGSPAEEAGLKKGDELQKINGLPVSFFSLEDMTRKLRKKTGKKIKLVVKRGDERLKFYFELRSLI